LTIFVKLSPFFVQILDGLYHSTDIRIPWYADEPRQWQLASISKIPKMTFCHLRKRLVTIAAASFRYGHWPVNDTMVVLLIHWSFCRCTAPGIFRLTLINFPLKSRHRKKTSSLRGAIKKFCNSL